ncbi:MAG TPA: hypothetical protein VJ438_01995, partial [Candidatus Nanoarchaeia archaeon]|nr:hypothetical protein [Candidatus Nanoarchaeia archaeon]
QCQDAEVTNPEECGSFMEEKRIQEGIGINMPSECMGISIEECKVIMQEKGIEINKIEQVQRVEKVEKVERMQRMCKEGEVCDEGPVEYEEITLPKECMKIGVGDVTDCNMIAGRINEERIKNGEKMIIDENGKVDYINQEQIEKIADDSEKASQDIKPDFEKADEIKKEINNIEDNLNELGESNKEGIKENNQENNVVQQQNEARNEVQNEISSGGNSGGGANNVVESSGGNSGSSESGSDSGGSSGSGSSSSSSGESSSDSGGENAVVTGEIIGSGDKKSFLGKILKKIFGI